MRTVADTGPILAAMDPKDEAHELAVTLVSDLGRDLLVPTPVAVEIDHLLRSRRGMRVARMFLEALDEGVHTVAYLSPGLLAEAVAFDRTYADLNLGLTDACVMAIAQRELVPILTFDFEDFRATKPARGHWRLLVDEARYEQSVRAR